MEKEETAVGRGGWRIAEIQIICIWLLFAMSCRREALSLLPNKMLSEVPITY